MTPFLVGLGTFVFILGAAAYGLGHLAYARSAANASGEAINPYVVIGGGVVGMVSGLGLIAAVLVARLFA